MLAINLAQMHGIQRFYRWTTCCAAIVRREYAVVVESAIVFSYPAVLSFSSSSDAVGSVCLHLTAVAKRLGFGTAICVEIRRSRACQEQIQRTQISIRSLAYWLFQAPCQRWLPRRCVWRVTTYGPYVLPKHSATVQHSLAPLKACLHSYMYLLPCVNWMDKNAHCVYRAHDQWNRKCPNMAETRRIALRN